MTTWQVQTAKQRFSEVLRAVEKGEPQFITRRGETVAVIVDIEDYRRTHDERLPFGEFLVSSLADLGAELGLAEGIELPERTVDPDRAYVLFGED